MASGNHSVPIFILEGISIERQIDQSKTYLYQRKSSQLIVGRESLEIGQSLPQPILPKTNPECRIHLLVSAIALQREDN